jgi:predicted enzyme related to lactoylglutathione lyase
VRNGVITHTELASADPAATMAWAKTALGWKFGEAVPTPSGPYHMWRFETGTGGGIRSLNQGETSGATPYCEVPAIRAAWDKALEAGATAMMQPAEIQGGMGWIAVVSAPGGVPVGLWAPKE